jgi:hypothetical protein
MGLDRRSLVDRAAAAQYDAAAGLGERIIDGLFCIHCHHR